MKRDLLTCPDSDVVVHRARLREYEWLLGPDLTTALSLGGVDSPRDTMVDMDPMPLDGAPDEALAEPAADRSPGGMEWQ